MRKKLLSLFALLLTIATGAWAQEPTKYTVKMAEGTEDATKWEISPTEATTTGVDKDTKITATYSGTKRVKAVTAVMKAAAPAYTMAAAATDADKGKLICADGHIHANGEDAACTKARVAKIIYVGSSTDNTTYTHGLALALTDESNSNWDDAVTACSNKNTSLAITGGSASWMLPSQDQWNTMIGAAGTYDTLRDGFSSITGASNLLNAIYWSSSGGSSNKYAISFNVGTWNTPAKTINYLNVRACLAF